MKAEMFILGKESLGVSAIQPGKSGDFISDILYFFTQMNKDKAPSWTYRSAIKKEGIFW